MIVKPVGRSKSGPVLPSEENGTMNGHTKAETFAFSMIDARRRWGTSVEQHGRPVFVFAAGSGCGERALAQRVRRRMAEEPTLDPALVAALAHQLVCGARTAALEMAGQLLEALNQLPADQRRIVLWRVVNGLTFEEIAERLVFSADAVGRAFKHAVAALRKGVVRRGFA
jgi:DNA-directed RNA polymerase specialized sigma24 family protein